MIVLTLTNSPSNLTGDLTKWLIEIDSGVYVGNLNARVREALWQRVCDNIGSGRAIMVYSTNNEQKMNFYIHNSERSIENYDGLLLVKRPLPTKKNDSDISKDNIQKHSKKKIKEKKEEVFPPSSYVVLDVETTGLDSKTDELIEVGLIKIEDGIITDEYSSVLHTDVDIPNFIANLTGINNQMIADKGVDKSVVLQNCFDFIGVLPVVCFNANFDKSFLVETGQKENKVFPKLEFIDARIKIKKIMPGLESYKLSAISKALGVSLDQTHRALADCKLLYEVISKLNKI